MELVDFYGIPTNGGSLELLIRYRPDPRLVAAAQGQPIRLATHVGTAGGEMLLWDTPRSSPLPGPVASETEVAVPLVVPRQPGAYQVEVDAVVEDRFWASALGFPTAALSIERSANGDVLATDPANGKAHRVPAQQRFSIPHPRYGYALSERCIEVPWALGKYRGERRVLDIGYANAEPLHLQALTGLNVPLLVGLDIAAARIDGVAGVLADARNAPFKPRTFDLIFAISVIEHVGRDNRVYTAGKVGLAPDCDGDFHAISSLAGLLRPQGRLITTVPFGQAEDHGWFIQYDTARLQELVRASGLKLTEAAFYHYQHGWKGPVAPGRLGACRYRVEQRSAAAVACLELRQGRTGGPSFLTRVPRMFRRILERLRAMEALFIGFISHSE